jgi:hypothetical protein
MPALWNALSSAQRTAWDTFAALGAQALINSLGETYYASGYNWFVKCNVRLLRVGRTPISAVPVTARPSAPTGCALNITPIGSESDLCSGGTPTASSSDPAHLPADAFDDTLGTYWQTAAGITAAWLEYQLPATQIVRRYDIYIATYTYWENPDDWTFEAYNGATWDTLHTVLNWQVASSGWHSFYFPNSTSYTRYRINITGVKSGSGTTIILYELAMFNGALSASVLTYPQGTFTLVPRDCILHVALSISTARSAQYPGYYEILATQAPGTFHTALQTPLESRFGIIQTQRRWFGHVYRQTSEGIRSAPAAIAANTIE